MLRVGIIGASATRGWARESHVPAVQLLAGLKLAAVATNDQASAQLAAETFGAEAGYGDATELIRDPRVDIVTVAVNVPAHRQMVLSALSAGKHVYCEWPLGRNIGEAEEMHAAARSADVHVVIGLQARMSAAALRMRELILGGAIGRVLSARHYSATIAFGRKVPAASLHLEEPLNGATLVTIHGGHALDLDIAVLGGFTDLCALATTQYPVIENGEDGQRRTRLSHDHLLVQALVDDAALSVEVAGGRPSATPFWFEVVGETGLITLEGGAPRGFQSSRLRVSLNGKRQDVNEGESGSMPDTAANIAGMYVALRDDIKNGTHAAPDFAHAVRLTRLMDDVAASSNANSRTAVSDWPTK